MSEAELHILRARLDGGIRNKAARGELYRRLPPGYVRGDNDGELLIDPDEQVRSAIRAVFARFAEFGSVRQVWRWFDREKLELPARMSGEQVRWAPPSYGMIHRVLTSPVYAGAYVYGRTRRETEVDEAGTVRKHLRKLPRSQWPVLIHDHHQGYINWQDHEAIVARIGRNARPQPHGAGQGAVREGTALLKASPSAVSAAAGCRPITRGEPHRRAIIAGAKRRSRSERPYVCMSALFRSTAQWRRQYWKRSSPPDSKRR